MRNRSMGISPINPDLPVSQYIELGFNSQPVSGTADLFYDSGNTGIFTNDQIDVGGTSTNYWDTAGQWTPAGDTDHRDTSDEFLAFLNPKTLADVGGFLILASFSTTSTSQSGDMQMIDMHRASGDSASGGWGLHISSNNVPSIISRAYDNSSNGNFGQASAVNGETLNKARFAWFIDCTTDPATVTVWGKNPGGSDVAESTEDWYSHALLPQPRSAWGGSIGNAVANASSLNKEMLATCQPQGFFRVIRFEYDPADFIGDVVNEWLDIGPYEHRLRTPAGR